jgi:hypothetical protein
MGWGSGSRLAAGLIDAAKETISSDTERESFYEQMIEMFQDFDCDTLDECVGHDPVFDELWEKLYPSEDYDYWEDEDED